jgi:predicted nuclease with RNAse H fold
MKIIGIDLSGPGNSKDTCLVIFEDRGDDIHLVGICEDANDYQILQSIHNLDSKDHIVIGIDAPLSYNLGGGDRSSDKELRQLLRGKGRVGIMSPTMTRMAYLTLRGVALTRALEFHKPEYDLRIVEVHPGACMLLHGASAKDVSAFKKDLSARTRILNWLEGVGMKGIVRPEILTDHFVAACAAALGAWQWAVRKSAWHYPASPPLHPYDFAC